jgi:metallophosphoesterase (TIGR00282 family)
MAYLAAELASLKQSSLRQAIFHNVIPMRILFFGDVVGAIGRQALIKILQELKNKFNTDLTIANAENLAHGSGVTEQTLNELKRAGVDVFTGGNHSWSNPLGTPLYTDPSWTDCIIVPTNIGGAKNGNNWIVRNVNDIDVVIVNLMGQLFSATDTRSPFTELDIILNHERVRGVRVRVIDLHAEATAEKEAFGHYADGRVSAVFGTHTHVATADAKILTNGTAYVTDVGRCGSYDSVVGFEKKAAIQRFLTGKNGGNELDKTGTVEINGVCLTVDLATGKALALDRIREIVAV